LEKTLNGSFPGLDKDGWGTKAELDFVGNCLRRAEKASEKASFEPETLVAYHATFSKHYFTEASPDRELVKAAKGFLGISLPNDVRFWMLQEKYFILSWPLYAFV
jgi:hypothetical protein